MTNASGDLVVENLSKVFNTASGSLVILNNLQLTANRGDAVAITGPSGSGKSTLLYIIAALDTPTSGTVNLLGENPFSLSAGKQAEYRNSRIGFVFQDHHLLPQCTVLENVMIPVLGANRPVSGAEQRARDLLKRVGLGDRLHHRPAQISGGERQRAAICRALVLNPLLVLADEPTGNLDQANADEIGKLLLELTTEQQTILLTVTHSGELAARFPRHLVLRSGNLHTAALKSAIATANT